MVGGQFVEWFRFHDDSCGVKKSPDKFFLELRNVMPFSGPIIRRAVETASASVAEGEITDTLPWNSTGIPVFGFKMWPILIPSISKNRSN